MKRKIKLFTVALTLCVGGFWNVGDVYKSQDDGNSHCASMKDNPTCRNYGSGKNCDCKREPDENGECPAEGVGCQNHCCRKKCACLHGKCTPT